ncbi:glucosamine-6-phosphate deaminase, partial [Acinetobacter baumannii]|nr:glucosamine-6-phosphate deaminase [Acinetobacter baumannii]
MLVKDDKMKMIVTEDYEEMSLVASHH